MQYRTSKPISKFNGDKNRFCIYWMGDCWLKRHRSESKKPTTNAADFVTHSGPQNQHTAHGQTTHHTTLLEWNHVMCQCISREHFHFPPNNLISFAVSFNSVSHSTSGDPATQNMCDCVCVCVRSPHGHNNNKDIFQYSAIANVTWYLCTLRVILSGIPVHVHSVGLSNKISSSYAMHA